MSFRKGLCALLAASMLLTSVPAALMEAPVEAIEEEVVAKNVEEVEEASDYEMAGDAESVEEVTFELTGPVDEPAAGESYEVQSKGLPACDKPITTQDGFKVENGVVVGYIGTATEVAIPEIAVDRDDKTLTAAVRGIGSNVFGDKAATIISVAIPTYVENINSAAFQGCAKLTTVTLPGETWLKSIGSDAFNGCVALKTIVLPKDIFTIPERCFYNCTALESINLENVETILEDAFNGCTALTGVNLSKTRYIYENAFAACTALTTADLSETRVLNANAFSGCTGLTQVTVRGDLTLGGAFAGCSNLKKIIVTENSHYINYHFAEGMASVTEVVIPENVDRILDYAFAGTALTVLPEMKGVERIGTCAFADIKSLTDVTIPASVERINDAPFSGCNIKTITVDSGEKASYSAATLKMGIDPAPKVVLSSTAKAIPGGFYAGDTTLTKIDATILNAKIVSIGDRAFEGCANVAEITIPSTIKNIGEYAFKGCAEVRQVTIPSSVEVIGSAPFDGCNKLLRITVDSGEKASYSAADLKAGIALAPDVVLSDTAKAIPGYFYAGDKNLTKIDETILKPSIVTIGDGAFSGCEKVTEISIPKNIKTIGAHAFQNTNIAAVTIPDNVREIGDAPFDTCDYLKTITIKTETEDPSAYDYDYSSLRWGTHITKLAFADGSKTIPDGFYSDCSELSNGDFSVPATITAIGARAFAYCDSLTEFNFNEGIKKIGNGAFYETGLTTVKLPASLEGGTLGDVFACCHSLTSVDLSACTKITTIDDWAFEETTSLKEVKLPQSVTTIEEYAFSEAEKLTTINLDKVKRIGKNAFPDCKSLKEIVLADKTATLEEGALPKTVKIWCAVGAENVIAYAKKNGNEYEFLDPMNALTITFKDGKTVYDHTGSAITPEMVVKAGDTALTLNTDYTVTYENNVNVGKATATVTGLGKYKGKDEATSKRTFEFEIKSQIDSVSVSLNRQRGGYYYTGSPVEPEVMVKVGSETLVKGTDYTVSYANNISVGTATVTVKVIKAAYAGEKTLEFKIENKAIELPSKSQKATVNVGEVFNLVIPDGYTIESCKSSKKKVAEVDDDGLVSAEAVGKATITVKLDNKKSRKLTLTVEDPTLVTKIYFDEKGTQKLYVDETLELSCFMEPATAESDIIWKSSNPKVAEVDEDGVITGLKKGTATITATPTNPAKKSLKAKIKVKVVEE